MFEVLEGAWTEFDKKLKSVGELSSPQPSLRMLGSKLSVLQTRHVSAVSSHMLDPNTLPCVRRPHRVSRGSRLEGCFGDTICLGWPF